MKKKKLVLNNSQFLQLNITEMMLLYQLQFLDSSEELLDITPTFKVVFFYQITRIAAFGILQTTKNKRLLAQLLTGQKVMKMMRANFTAGRKASAIVEP